MPNLRTKRSLSHKINRRSPNLTQRNRMITAQLRRALLTSEQRYSRRQLLRLQNGQLSLEQLRPRLSLREYAQLRKVVTQ